MGEFRSFGGGRCGPDPFGLAPRLDRGVDRCEMLLDPRQFGADYRDLGVVRIDRCLDSLTPAPFEFDQLVFILVCEPDLRKHTILPIEDRLDLVTVNARRFRLVAEHEGSSEGDGPMRKVSRYNAS
jgi:hypothetical protein